MGLHFNYDYWNNMETPSFILCTVDKNRIGTLNVSGKHLRYNHEIPEISFRIYQFVDGEKNPYYDKVLEFQYVLLPEIGYFQIMQKPVVITDRNMEYKEVTAQSAEIELGQKYLNTFSINMGTVESIDGVCLYQAGDSKHSLLNLVLEKLPSWSINYVDPKIATLQRSFEVDNQDVYSFLTSDVSKAFGCIFIFDTLHNTIHVYEQDSVSEDTNIVISFQNLAKKIKLTPDADSVKTCVTLVGSDSLTIRELNMGYDRIYNFDYFATPEYMGQELIDAYKDYQKAYEQYNKQYTPLLAEYQDLILEIARLDHEMLPETPLPTKDGQLITTDELAENTEVWKEYCLTELETYKKAYEGRQSVLMQKGFGSAKKVEYDATEKNISYSADAAGNTHMRLEYKSLYVPVYLILQHINSEIAARKAQIQELENNKKSLKLQMENIISLIDIQKNFSKEQWLYLSKFIREETLSDSNYVVTKTMTKEEELEMKQAFLDFGKKELSRVSQPQFSFTMDMANIFAFPEFRNQLDKFDLFNYITVLIRDDYYMKVKILSFDIDFEDRKNFSVTFGSIYKYKNKDIFTTAVDAMAAASSASTSVSFNKFQWNNGTEDAFDIKDKISSGLINAGVSLSNSRSTMEIDERGLFMNNDSDSEHPNEKTALTGSNLLFTTDNWQTVRTALGRIQYIRSDGTNVDTYGLIAETVLSGYIGGSLIEGNTINGGTINGNNINGGTITGSTINNGNKTFYVDENGNLTASKATITGNITATTLTATESGKIGGWEISKYALYNGIPYKGGMNKDPESYNSCGIGTWNADGSGNWAFWAGDGLFSVTKDGILHAESATIKGKIETNDITATKGTFTHVIIGDSCRILGDCIIDGRTWGDGFTVDTACKMNARNFEGEGFKWLGNAVGSGYIDSELSSKKFHLCFTDGNLGINGNSDYVGNKDGKACLIGASGAIVGSSGSTYMEVNSLGVKVNGSFYVSGSGGKSRLVDTSNYGNVCLDAYETPTPMFGDIGTAQLDSNGEIYIWIDPVFNESIEEQAQYKIFITKYGCGELYVDIKNSTKDYFIIRGTPYMEFAWEIKNIQKDMMGIRFSPYDLLNANTNESVNYEAESDFILKELEGELDYAI